MAVDGNVLRVFARLLASDDETVDLRDLAAPDSATAERATIAAMRAGAPIILAPVLPRDDAGHRAGRPSALIREAGDGPGYHPVQIKFHRVLETVGPESPPLSATTLDAPELPELYVIASPVFNAMTIGIDTPKIVVNSALVVSCPPFAVPPSSRSVTRTRASPAEDTQLSLFRLSGCKRSGSMRCWMVKVRSPVARSRAGGTSNTSAFGSPGCKGSSSTVAVRCWPASRAGPGLMPVAQAG